MRKICVYGKGGIGKSTTAVSYTHLYDVVGSLSVGKEADILLVNKNMELVKVL